MRLSFLFCLGFLLTGGLLMTSPSAAQAATGSPQNGTVVKRLTNGLTVLVRPDHRFPLVSLRLYVHAGSTYETPEEAGISHLLEHMVFKGTEERPKGQVAADVEATGGYLNAGTSFDYTVYLTDMTKEHWKTGMDVLKDMAFHPTLNPDELASEKEVVIAELKRGEDNPGQRLFRMTQGTALQGTPYRNPIIGYENTVRSITSKNMRDYILRLYQPQSMLLVVCGDVDADDVLGEATRLFGSISNTRPVTPPAAIDASSLVRGFSATVEEGPWNKVHFALALPVPHMSDVRAAQLDILAQVLGGDATSRLYRTYKYEKRLVDSISVRNYSFERLGFIYIQATLDADKVPAFWESLCQDFAKLGSATFSEEELARAKLNLEDDLFRSKETLAGLASKLGYFAFFDNGEQGEENYLSIIKATDQRVLADLIREYFKPDALTLAALLPQGTALGELLPKGREHKADTWEGWFTDTLAEKWQAFATEPKNADSPGNAGASEIIALGDGRTVVLTPDTTLPYAAVNLLFAGGNALTSEEEQGLASFTASLLTKGTSTLSATAFEDYLSDRAASFSASGGRQTFAVSVDAPSRFLDDMFSLLKSTLDSPALLEEEAARVRQNQIAAITNTEDQPTGLAFRRMFPFLFGEHPYGYLQLGEKERVAAFSTKDAATFWKEQKQQPWVLSVCGTFDREAVLKAARELPVPDKKAAVVNRPDWGKNKQLDLTLPGRNQAHLLMVFPTVAYGEQDEPGLDLLQNILAGQSGLLFSDLRDKQGLGYTVTAFPWKSEKAGAIIFYIGTEPDKMQQAEQGFRKVIADLQDSLLPDEELVRGKNKMEGDYYRDHQSLGSRSAEAAILTLLQRPLDASRKLVEKAGEVDAETLRELARKYLQPDKSYIIKVLP